MDSATFPVKPIMQSLLAEMYQRYLNNNLWKFRNRTETTEEDPADLSTWSIERIADEVAELYWSSLENEQQLLATDIRRFAAITAGEKNTDQLRPTLFDFLAHRAIAHFRNEQTYLTRPAEQFGVTDRAAFWDADVFADHEFVTTDRESFKYQTLLLFQKLLKVHQADEDPAALIDIDLQRLDFLYDHGRMEQKDEHFLAALQRLQEKYAQHEGAAEVAFHIAKLYDQQADRYLPSFRDERKAARKKRKNGAR